MKIKSRKMNVTRMGEDWKVYKALVGKPEGKTPLGRPRRRWEDGIRMDLRKIGWRSVEWIQFPQDRDRWQAVVNTVMNLRILAPRSWLVGWLVGRSVDWWLVGWLIIIIINSWPFNIEITKVRPIYCSCEAVCPHKTCHLLGSNTECPVCSQTLYWSSDRIINELWTGKEL
jgi:hypothetical protein